MGNLRLDLNDLSVDSFSATPFSEASDGTVHGQDSFKPDCQLSGFICTDQCPSVGGSCYAFCTAAESCIGTCNDECISNDNCYATYTCEDTNCGTCDCGGGGGGGGGDTFDGVCL